MYSIDLYALLNINLKFLGMNIKEENFALLNVEVLTNLKLIEEIRYPTGKVEKQSVLIVE